MDGTIADLYGVKNWLFDLESENTRPYEIASPLYEVEELNSLLNMAKARGWKVVVTTWLAKGGSKEYYKAVTKAKKEWLEKYNFPADEVHCVKYGTTKASCTRKAGGFQILIDDNKKVRRGWKLGTTIDASKDIRPFLKSLV
jgi:hypothetical protein